METYIAILRGINVSGYRVIKMADLKVMCAELGFRDCQTYIQSGNIIFRYGKAASRELATAIERKILEKFGFEVPAIVMEVNELNEIIADNPFLSDPSKDKFRLHVTFLSDYPELDRYNNIRPELYFPVEFRLKGRSIYLYCPEGYSSSKLTNSFLETKLRINATTRNWKTTCELLLLAEKTDNQASGI